MKQFLLILAVVALVGCTITIEFPRSGQDKQAKPFTNTLGMKFVSVPGTKVAFCIWETRVKDYAAASEDVNTKWKKPRLREQTGFHPVVHVSWREAEAFCIWLTKKERSEGKITDKQLYRLPTDAEWSRAAGIKGEKGSTPRDKWLSHGITSQQKALENGVFLWGMQWPPPNGAGNYRWVMDNYEGTSPVGSFPPDSNGIYDLGGNVWEWCNDWYDSEQKGKVVKGASWVIGSGRPNYLLPSYRGALSPVDYRENDQGFRCVLATD